MDMYFRSIIKQDRNPVVICDSEHKIIYMNPASADRYKNRGGYDLVGKSLLDCHNPESNELIKKTVEWFAESEEHNVIHTFYNPKENKDVYMVALRDDDKKLIGYYEKHEGRNRETASFYDF